MYEFVIINSQAVVAQQVFREFGIPQINVFIGSDQLSDKAVYPVSLATILWLPFLLHALACLSLDCRDYAR
jgi:hypothetical protein